MQAQGLAADELWRLPPCTMCIAPGCIVFDCMPMSTAPLHHCNPNASTNKGPWMPTVPLPCVVAAGQYGSSTAPACASREPWVSMKEKYRYCMSGTGTARQQPRTQHSAKPLTPPAR